MLTLSLASPEFAQTYRAEQLNRCDQQRLQHSPQLAEKTDWLCSRALKQQACTPIQSLSHSHGCAMIATGHLKAGVDIERIHPRDFASLMAWIASPEEQQWWQQRGGNATDFYLLWTLKEALIKACQLNFPADMPQVGLRHHNQRFSAHAQQQTWQHICAEINGFIASAVWQSIGTQIQWQTYGTWQNNDIHIIMNNAV